MYTAADTSWCPNAINNTTNAASYSCNATAMYKRGRKLVKKVRQRKRRCAVNTCPNGSDAPSMPCHILCLKATSRLPPISTMLLQPNGVPMLPRTLPPIVMMSQPHPGVLMPLPVQRKKRSQREGEEKQKITSEKSAGATTATSVPATTFNNQPVGKVSGGNVPRGKVLFA